MDDADAPRPDTPRPETPRAEQLAALSGRYGVHPQSQPAAAALPAATRWLLAGLALVVLLGGVVWALVAGGADLAGAVLGEVGEVGEVPWAALLVLGGGWLVVRWVRAGEPHTVLDADALVVSSGGRRRRVGWEEVAAVRPAPRFTWWPAAVLTDGSRLELPGVPPEVADALADLLGPPLTQQPPPSTTRDDDGGWDGPFRTGRAGG